MANHCEKGNESSGFVKFSFFWLTRELLASQNGYSSMN